VGLIASAITDDLDLPRSASWRQAAGSVPRQSRGVTPASACASCAPAIDRPGGSRPDSQRPRFSPAQHRSQSCAAALGGIAQSTLAQPMTEHFFGHGFSAASQGHHLPTALGFEKVACRIAFSGMTFWRKCVFRTRADAAQAPDRTRTMLAEMIWRGA